MGESGLNSERDIINRFQELKQELNALSSKFNDIDNQAQEHDSVIKALTPLDSNIKCFRLIGGVLVERTVAEVLPAVKGNGEQIRMVDLRIATSLEKQTRAKEKELVEFQEKYKIRMKGEGDEDAAASKKASSKDRKEGSGVLVSKQ
ncbi:MAG: Prefoldin subunit 2 [Trebouxia sp. A1-2]|nr:MAG: Prefoldin subunit 2 [Trebouxia sp. A1-2]